MSIKEIVDNTKHSKIGASSMYRWSACPGSVQLSQLSAVPSSSVHAIEGTVAHEVSAYYLLNGHWPLPDQLGVTISELTGMIKQGCSKYVEYIEQLHDQEPKSKFHIEHSFDMDCVYPGAYGTADCVTYNETSKLLRVIDYKHGKGLVVEVENNTQLLYYALGAIVTLKYPFSAVELIVVQPRAFHPKGPIRKWIVGVEEILNFEQDLIAAAKRTEERNPEFNAGGHCFFCAAIDICPKSQEAKAAKASTVMKPGFNHDPSKDFEPVPREDVFEF